MGGGSLVEPLRGNQQKAEPPLEYALLAYWTGWRGLRVHSWGKRWPRGKRSS